MVRFIKKSLVLKVIWSSSTDGEDKWNNVNFVIGPQEHGYEIVFEAYHGTSAGNGAALMLQFY